MGKSIKRKGVTKWGLKCRRSRARRRSRCLNGRSYQRKVERSYQIGNYNAKRMDAINVCSF